MKPIIINTKLSEAGEALSEVVNPNMMEVVKKEILKVITEGIIYLIVDNEWVSPVHIVPKISGNIIVENKKEEIIP